MKKITIFLLSALILGSYSFNSWAQSKPAESQSSLENTPKVSTVKIIGNALLLADIYRKIQKISGTDQDKLNPLLTQLNGALDEVLAFKNSFTPSKRQKVENQLSKLKNQIQVLAEKQSKDFQSQTLQLTSTLLDLVDTLLDKAQGNKM